MPVDKLVYSLVVLVVLLIMAFWVKHAARLTQVKNKLHKSRYYMIKRIINFIFILLFVVGIMLIWGLNIKNIWIGLSSILAMIAVAFFAIWSLIGNILAGIILYFSSPFKIDDFIEILPDNVCGKVVSINTFYTLLQDSNNDYISVPNSLFFQKYITKFRGHKLHGHDT